MTGMCAPARWIWTTPAIWAWRVAPGGVPGVPLLYTPWIDFPLQERRKSGLLAPTFKLGGGNGIEFAQPYYLNLAPNYDATVIPRVPGAARPDAGRRVPLPDAGLQRADGRRNHAGRPQAQWRHLLFAYTLSHLQQAPSLNMAFGYNIRYASDNDYFRDFGDRRAIADGANLLREGWANWHSPFGFFTVKAQRYKTMQDSKALVDEPCARLPQLTWNYGIGLPAGVEANFYAEYNQFSHGQQVVNGGLNARQDGKRLTFYPSLSCPCKPATALSPRKSACTTPNTGCRRKTPRRKAKLAIIRGRCQWPAWTPAWCSSATATGLARA